MPQESDIDMGDDSRFYYASENQGSTSSANESAPSWVSQIVRLLTQVIRNQPSQQNSQPLDQKPGHSQPHPEKFSGNDQSSYPQFRSLLEAKLRIDAKAIGSEEERVWYGFGRLSLTASRRIHPWIEYAKDTDKFTVKEFLNRLDKAFGDTEKITKAINKLNSMRQRNREFREFLQDFEQTILEAQGWGWEDEVRKGYLRAALNRELTDRLVTQDEPATYDDFVAQLRRTSDKMEALRGWNNSRNNNRSSLQTPQVIENEVHGDPMDWEPAQPVNVAASQHLIAGRSRMPQANRAVWVSHDEIGRRISEGLCIRCGARNHRIRECSLLPAINPNRRKQILQPKVAASSSLVETVNDGDVSGKE
ncbi:hypothetical protein OnM2_055069 [Erysiphe neolycopersici]|uniref:Retrotransposon gag domain-containing protein n=1 Tax=Erysiphe neolycopersici TaxID=212602 RepID=A0A420HRB6_9PEZI|nr:hypothetical protein OnM2_055069 [Erysiphe neolycopersici]